MPSFLNPFDSVFENLKRQNKKMFGLDGNVYNDAPSSGTTGGLKTIPQRIAQEIRDRETSAVEQAGGFSGRPRTTEQSAVEQAGGFSGRPRVEGESLVEQSGGLRSGVRQRSDLDIDKTTPESSQPTNLGLATPMTGGPTGPVDDGVKDVGSVPSAGALTERIQRQLATGQDPLTASLLTGQREQAAAREAAQIGAAGQRAEIAGLSEGEEMAFIQDIRREQRDASQNEVAKIAELAMSKRDQAAKDLLTTELQQAGQNQLALDAFLATSNLTSPENEAKAKQMAIDAGYGELTFDRLIDQQWASQKTMAGSSLVARISSMKTSGQYTDPTTGQTIYPGKGVDDVLDKSLVDFYNASTRSYAENIDDIPQDWINNEFNQIARTATQEERELSRTNFIGSPEYQGLITQGLSHDEALEAWEIKQTIAESQGMDMKVMPDGSVAVIDAYGNVHSDNYSNYGEVGGYTYTVDNENNIDTTLKVDGKDVQYKVDGDNVTVKIGSGNWKDINEYRDTENSNVYSLGASIATDISGVSPSEIEDRVSPDAIIGDFVIGEDGNLKEVYEKGKARDVNLQDLDVKDIVRILDTTSPESISDDVYNRLSRTISNTTLSEDEIKTLMSNDSMRSAFNETVTATEDKGWSDDSGRTKSKRQMYNGSIGDVIERDGEKYIVVNIQDDNRAQRKGSDYGQQVHIISLDTGETTIFSSYGKGNKNRR